MLELTSMTTKNSVYLTSGLCRLTRMCYWLNAALTTFQGVVDVTVYSVY